MIRLLVTLLIVQMYGSINFMVISIVWGTPKKVYDVNKMIKNSKLLKQNNVIYTYKQLRI